MPDRDRGHVVLRLTRHPRRRAAAIPALALALAGACSSDATTSGPAPSPTDASAATALYDGFPDCEPLPSSVEHDPIVGLVGLDGMAVLDVRRTGPIVSVTGLVDATPLDVRDRFAARDDVEVIHVEDEGYEAEVLVASGEHRTFLKATIRCRTGSVVALVVAPAADAGSLPTPGGG